MAVPPPSPAKIAMRARLRAARRDHVRSFTAEQRDEAARAAAERVMGHVPPGATVALHHPWRDELDPQPLGRLLAAAGHPLALPCIAADGLRFRAWRAGDRLVAGPHGVPQPGEEQPERVPTVVVVPLVGFDRVGGRLGQGAGCYDRALARLPDARRIGYGWSVQEAATMPSDPWDVPLHAVATEGEWIACPS